MSKKLKIAAVVVLLAIVALLVTAREVRANPRFVIAGWGELDEYGQGIEAFDIEENSSGTWQSINGPFYNDDPCIFNWSAGVAIKLTCYTWFNSTLTGADSIDNGRLLQRHNVTVTNLADEIVFSKQNFTWYSQSGEFWPMWWYEYYVVLNFLPLYWEYYTVTVTYEVFY